MRRRIRVMIETRSGHEAVPIFLSLFRAFRRGSSQGQPFKPTNRGRIKESGKQRACPN